MFFVVESAVVLTHHVYMLRPMRFAALLALIALSLPAPLAAHDSWISRGALRNSAGEWCCGEGDCVATPAQHVTLPAPGYRLPSGEFIPETETQFSPDGQFWRCKRPDGSPRCFFAPPEGF